MDLVPYDPSFDASLAGFYNVLVSGVPHCYPVAPDDMGAALARSHERLRDQRILVAHDDAIHGFVHYAVQPANDEVKEDLGIIAFLGFARGRRKIGQALLDAAEADLRTRGIAKSIAFHQRYRYPFYGFNHCYLSNRLDHVEALFGFNGYKKEIGGEIFLDAVHYTPVEPVAVDLDFEIVLEWQDGPGKRPDLVVRALRGDKQLGRCINISCARFGRDTALEDWHFCDGLDVEDPFQGRNLGRHLLERSLLEMHGIGYRHAGISTGLQNFRAAQFYSNYGYRAVDYTYGWAKDL